MAPGSSAAGTHLWKFVDHRWQITDVPGQSLPRRSPALEYNPVDQKVYMFGGYVATTSTNATDTWTYDGTSWTNLFATGVTGGSNPRIAFDRSRSKMVLVINNSTYELNGTTWELKAAAPAFFVLHLAYDPNCLKVVAFGMGEVNGHTNYYQWSGSSWAVMQSGAVQQRSLAIGYIPALDSVITGGGYTALTQQTNTLAIACDGETREMPATGPGGVTNGYIESDYPDGDSYQLGGLVQIGDSTTLSKGADVWKFVAAAAPRTDADTILSIILGFTDAPTPILLQDANGDQRIDCADILAVAIN